MSKYNIIQSIALISSCQYNMISEGPVEAVTIKDKLIVVQQKMIDKQVAYLIVSDNKSSWVKLCQATESQMKAIMKFQSDRNNGIQPIYHPGADEQDSGIHDMENHKQQHNKQNLKYNLRERQLLLITSNQFYGLKQKEEKKENLSYLPKLKKQIKKQEIKSKKSTLKFNGQVKSKLQGIKQDLSNFQLKKKPINKNQIINLEKNYKKRKQIKKQQSLKLENQKFIQIYDGSDSELKIL